MPKTSFGSYFREKRLARDYTLRKFCKKYGYDTAYISRLENEKIAPPLREKLVTLAGTLGLKKDSKEWVDFFDLAYQAREEIPVDIRKNAPEIISMLPAFLRTKDSKRINRQNLKKLINFLRKG